MSTHNLFILPKNSLPAPEFEASGRAWNPHVHFMGTTGTTPDEVDYRKFIQYLINKYGRSIVAYHSHCPFQGKYFSVELQLHDDAAGRRLKYEHDHA
jgi:hypothetical protein